MSLIIIRNWLGGVALAFISSTAPQAARAYQVDCAILLCLAGGWPASAECAHARAVFIRRITPWPIEPTNLALPDGGGRARSVAKHSSSGLAGE